MKENPPPPVFDFDIDKEFDQNIINLEFRYKYHRPQRTYGCPLFQVDYNLIHPKLLGHLAVEAERQSSTEIERGENIRTDAGDEISRRRPFNISKFRKGPKDKLLKNYDFEQVKIKREILESDESTLVPEDNALLSEKEQSQEEKDKHTTSDEPTSSKVKEEEDQNPLQNVNQQSALSSISESYSTKSISESDGEIIEDSEREKCKESKSSAPLEKSPSSKSVSQSEGEILEDSDREKPKKSISTSNKKKSLSTKSISESDGEIIEDSDREKHKKSKSSHRKKSHSKKSKHKRRDKDSRNETSCSGTIQYDQVGSRSSELSVKQEIISPEEENFTSSFSKKVGISVKEEMLSAENDDEKDKIKSSKKKHRTDDSRKNYRGTDSRKKYVDDTLSDSASSDDSRNRHYDDDSRSKHYDDSRSKQYKSRGRHSDDSRDRYSDDSRYDDSSQRDYRPYIKTEIKEEFASTECRGLSDYYCDVCKLMLNSESTFNSHMAGKRHKKALRQLSETDVAKSSIVEITESQYYPRPPIMDRIELYGEVSRIKSAIDDAIFDAKLPILGLENVQEIRGYDETKYYCDLCSAQCVANSIIKHLIGFKHQMNCLKKYYPMSYECVKDFDKKDPRLTRELERLKTRALDRRGSKKIRVFKDVARRSQRSPEPYDPHQPSTSRQGLDAPVKKSDELKVTDEECLSRDYSDFYCKVCDSHMNNYSMWESHARGKRHAKNKKKAPLDRDVSSANFVEAPHGTISHLEEMIHEECDPKDIIVGLNFIRENQGENGDLYNCYLCGSVCPTIDIIDHLYLRKHKTKYLEKLNNDGFPNGIEQINKLPVGDYAKEGLIDAECLEMLKQYGPGKPVVCISKKIY